MTEVAEKTVVRTSRIGKLPVTIPKGVTVSVTNGAVSVKGAKGTLSWSLPQGTTIAVENEKVHVSAEAGRGSARMQGLARALIANMVRGTSEGFSKTLLLVGTGYRAEVKGTDLHMSVGLSHPVVFAVPDGISITVPKDSKGAQIVVAGADRSLVGETAARIRSTRPPEPYGGKGVRYQGEQVREKAGKSGKGAKGAR
ncbi:MAG: 50S ribosomal protein L6 [Deltaproteobacteria bacterium HGW-Deltaproteobacteria-20]|jgi:large subunit ribosomal protein L6|nr:MAG: 50S ribosomal protein L6 [Deltaproteobacteria bacterium HGW-Deltaproteobacteria-20]